MAWSSGIPLGFVALTMNALVAMLLCDWPSDASSLLLPFFFLLLNTYSKSN